MPVGTVAGTFDDVFSLGRRTWKISSVEGTTILVQRCAGKGPAPIFQRSQQRGAFDYLLPRKLTINM